MSPHMSQLHAPARNDTDDLRRWLLAFATKYHHGWCEDAISALGEGTFGGRPLMP